MHRFVVGEDTRVRVLDADDAARELGDPFATVLLLRGVFPRTAGEVARALDRAVPPGDPLRDGFFFLLGEGSQIPVTPPRPPSSGGCGSWSRAARGPGADILLSAFHPDEGTVELMAWDRRQRRLQLLPDRRRQLGLGVRRQLPPRADAPTQGKGPFESHLSGNFVMKELRLPWVHWHSLAANILPSVLPAGPAARPATHG